MNWAQFKKNVGTWVQLEPIVCRLDKEGNELPEVSDDWIVQSFSPEDVVSLSNTATGHVVRLGKDCIYDFRSNPARSDGGVKHSFLVLKVQVFLQGNKLWCRPNARPGERVGPQPSPRQKPIWTQFIRVNTSDSVPPNASFARIQYKLWSEDANVPLMIRVASEQDGKFAQELSGPSGVVDQMITEKQAFYVSLSHPRVQYEIGVLGYRFD